MGGEIGETILSLSPELKRPPRRRLHGTIVDVTKKTFDQHNMLHLPAVSGDHHANICSTLAGKNAHGVPRCCCGYVQGGSVIDDASDSVNILHW